MYAKPGIVPTLNGAPFIQKPPLYYWTTAAAFRVAGKTPRLWHPESGETEPVSYTTEQGHTAVPLHFDAQGSVFVVFEGSGVAPSRTIPQPTATKVAALDGAWKLTFPPNLGAPPEATFPTLTSWTRSSDAGVKYFSGTATRDQRKGDESLAESHDRRYAAG